MMQPNILCHERKSHYLIVHLLCQVTDTDLKMILIEGIYGGPPVQITSMTK